MLCFSAEVEELLVGWLKELTKKEIGRWEVYKIVLILNII